MAREAEGATVRALSRPMIPREHGAWAMLFVPFAVAVGVAWRIDLMVVLFLLATLSFYLARAPLERLGRSKGQERREAWLWLSLYSTMGGLFTAPLLLYGKLWLLIPFGALLVAFLLLHLYLSERGIHRSLWGRFLSIAGLTTTILPAYYVAAGTIDSAALLLWALSLLFFSGALFHVRFRVRRATRPGEGRVLGRITIVYYVAGLILVGLLGYLQWLPLLTFIAFIPSAFQMVRDLIRVEERLDLKRIGFLELGHALGFALLLIGAYKLDGSFFSGR